MRHAQQLDTVRRLVQETFQTYGLGEQEEILEKILIRDGFYCGRCFLYDGFRAVWFIEENTVKFYRPDGTYLCAASTVAAAGWPERRVA